VKENYQEDIQQNYCMDGMTRNLIGNIGEDWKEIGDNRDQEEQKKGRH